MTASPWPVTMRAITVFALVLAVVLLAGCQTAKPVIVPKVEERRIEVPASLLSCMPEPVAARGWATQRDVGLFMVRLAEAGADCRAKLAVIRRLIESQ